MKRTRTYIFFKTFLICLGLAGMSLTHSTFAGTFIPIRVHAGGSAYTDSLGQTWNADTDFSGGDVYSTASPINNTPDPALYQTERWGAFSYQFAVPNGSYSVVLKFAEIYWNSVGQRVFNVSINGTQVLTNFDIVAAAGAPLTAIDQTFPVTVTNGTVTIQFIPGSADLPKVSAIEITQGSGSTPTPPAPTPTPSPTRVHAGGGSYTDSLGQTWNADTDFSGGDVYNTASPINNTPDPALYQTERWGAFSYQFAVPNGSYSVVLKFAEIYWNSVGQRVFNVSINGTQVLTNFDIVAAAGAPLTAIDQTFPVTVTNGTVTIQFIPGSADLPKVSAINLVPSSSTSPPVGQLTLSQTNFAFGNVYIGTTVSQTFTLSNTGTATITFSGVSVSGAGVSATGVSNGVMLKPGQSITLTATFTPATVAAVTGSVAFTSNAANPSATIVLSGTGVQPPPATHSVSLTWNPSTSPEVIGYFVYRGAASAGPFTVLNTSPISTTAYTDTTVQSGQVYYYVVTAVDSSDTQSTYSNVASATIP